jgi:hypothetical protein
MTNPVRDRAEWLARTLIRGDQFITVGVLESGEVRVEYGKGAYILTIRDKPTWPGDDLDGVRAALALEVRDHARTADEVAGLQARVDKLTATLFELVGAADRVVHHEGVDGVSWLGLLANRVAESRAVLARAAK